MGELYVIYSFALVPDEHQDLRQTRDIAEFSWIGFIIVVEGRLIPGRAPGSTCFKERSISGLKIQASDGLKPLGGGKSLPWDVNVIPNGTVPSRHRRD
jgi:hypothetical protein